MKNFPLILRDVLLLLVVTAALCLPLWVFAQTPPPHATLDQTAFAPSTLSLQALILTALNVDRIQTNREPSLGMHEINPALGRYPSRSRVNNYFFGVALSHTVAVFLLPPDERILLQGVTLGIEGAAIVFNFSNGLGD
jgi:hypothetical protein